MVMGLRWLAPFGGFLVGYLLTGYFFHRAELPTPHVIGKPLHEAVQMLSNARLGLRLLAQREEPTLPEGTVLEQLPSPGQRTRPNQNVFVTISTKEPQQQTPDWWGKRVKEAVSDIEHKGLVSKIWWLEGPYPKGMCVAQIPTAQQPLAGKTVTILGSLGPSPLHIMPSFKGMTVPELEQLLQGKDVRVQYFHHMQELGPDHVCTACRVADQQPAAGALVDLGKTLAVQLDLSLSAPAA